MRQLANPTLESEPECLWQSLTIQFSTPVPLRSNLDQSDQGAAPAASARRVFTRIETIAPSDVMIPSSRL